MANKDPDDLELFRKHFGDIRRIKSDRIEPSRKTLVVNPQKNRALDKDDLDPFANMLDKTDDLSSYRAQGMQNRQFQKLQRGQLPIEARLDLHSHTRTLALEKLRGFIASNQQQGKRHLLVIHGKGYQSEDGQPVLKPAVIAWLRKMQAVMAFCPAQAADGGDGALYVLLKKR